MIIAREWNRYKQQLEISYIDKQGNRQMFVKPIARWKTYQYDEKGNLNTWNNKKCIAVYKDSSTYSPNEFDILEYIFGMKNNLSTAKVLDELYAHNPINMFTYDIETEVSEEFPEPSIAAQRITAISLVGPNMSCLVMGLKRMSIVQEKLLNERYQNFIKNNEFASQQAAKSVKSGVSFPTCKYKFFDTEEALLKYWMLVLIPKITFLAGWNSYGFDRTYIENRCKRLFGELETNRMIKKGSPTYRIKRLRWLKNDDTYGEVHVPMHMMEFDYMELVKKYEYAFRPYESYSLDYCGSHIVNAHKIKYDGTLQELYERDYEWYYYYNAIDSLIVQLIHKRTKCVSSPAAVGTVTLVGLEEAMGQIAMTTANIFRVFYDNDLHVVYDRDEIERVKKDFPGAFCGAVQDIHNWTACFDFKSLYPTQIRTCNFSFENFIQPTIGPDSLGRYTPRQWTEKELEEFKKDPNYFVTVNNNVYKNDRDYGFKQMQEKNTKNRDKYKYLGQKINAQILSEIERLIKEKENDTK